MNRRTRAQHITDDLAYPIRIKFCVPEFGLGSTTDRMVEWLGHEVGQGNFAVHNAQTISSSAVAVYFVSLTHAQRFLSTFPALEMADGTQSAVYSAP